jgi:hypothetical protein
MTCNGVTGHGSSASGVTHARSSGSPTGEFREGLSGSLVNKVFVGRIAIAGIYDPGQYVPPRLWQGPLKCRDS